MNYPLTYAVKHKDLNTRMLSRSGGIFTVLSDYVLEQKGVIYGCVLDNDNQAFHLRANSYEERNRMRGSKYIQSRMEDCFKEAKNDLINGREVLFSGTSCQISGLRTFLGKNYDNLITVDIVCHGVPSPLVWETYLKWQEKKHNGKCVSVDFRNKKDFGWARHIETLMIEKADGGIEKVSSDAFATIFYGHSALRPSCYKCPYKDVIHPADITIADYWGIDIAAPGFNDNKGVSLVLINNKKGEEIISFLKERTDYIKTELKKSMQPPLKAPFDKPKKRDVFWKDFRNEDFDKIVKKYGTKPLTYKIKKKLKTFFR